MNMVEIIDINGNKTSVSGIYYISHNNYYFIYTKKEQDNDNHIIFYIVKILQELVNGVNGPSPTGYLIGLRINDDNEYNLVKSDITNIVSDKENNTESVKYLDLSMLKNLKIQDYRTFKLSIDIYNKMFEQNTSNLNIDSNNNNSVSMEQLIKENENLKKELEEYKRKLSLINEIIN